MLLVASWASELRHYHFLCTFHCKKKPSSATLWCLGGKIRERIAITGNSLSLSLSLPSILEDSLFPFIFVFISVNVFVSVLRVCVSVAEKEICIANPRNGGVWLLTCLCSQQFFFFFLLKLVTWNGTMASKYPRRSIGFLHCFSVRF